MCGTLSQHFFLQNPMSIVRAPSRGYALLFFHKGPHNLLNCQPIVIFFLVLSQHRSLVQRFEGDDAVMMVWPDSEDLCGLGSI